MASASRRKLAQHARIVAEVEKERLRGASFKQAVQRTGKRVGVSPQEVIKTLFAAGMLRPQVPQVSL